MTLSNHDLLRHKAVNDLNEPINHTMISSQTIHLTIAAVAALAVAACSSESPGQQEVSENSISFETQIASIPGAQSDGTDSHEGVTTTENIPEFRVWAYDPWAYRYVMEGVTVTRTGLNNWTYSPAAEWPGNPVNFTAVSPASVPFIANPYWVDMVRYTNPGNEDLLVAKITGVTQTSGRLRLHFYHALAMVKVMLHTSLPPGRVRVKSVSVMNVANFGQFQFPGDGFSNSATAEDISACWDLYGGGTRLPLFLSDTGVALRSEPLYADNQGFNFFIPTILYPFDFDAYFNSSYLEVDYRIEDEEGNTIWPDATTDRRLLSALNPGYGELRLGLGDKIPEGRWLAGKCYRYSVDLSAPATVPPGAMSESSEMESLEHAGTYAASGLNKVTISDY